MAIEKEVAIQLKVKRPDSAALKAAADNARGLHQAIERSGPASRALDDAAARAKRLEQATKAGAMSVTNLAREYGKQAKASQEVERVTTALVRQGVAADRAREAASRLVRSLSDGARVAEHDVNRLATAMRATGGGGAPGGMARFFPTFGGLGAGTGSLLTRFGPAAAVAMLTRNISQSATEAMQTDADQEIRSQVMRSTGTGLGGVARRTAHGFIERTPVLSHIAQGLTFDAREGAAQSAAAVQRAQARRQRLLADIQRQEAQASGRLTIEGVQRQGALDFAGARIDAGAALLRGRERIENIGAERSFDSIALRMQREQDAFTTGRINTFGGGLAALRAESMRGGGFGAEAMFRNQQQRGLALGELQAARGAGAGATTEAARDDAIRRQVDATQRLAELERQRLDLVRQSGEAEVQRAERFRQFAQQAEQSYRQLAERERERNQGFAESFGAMNEMQRRRITGIAQRAAGGGIGGLSADELRELQGTGIGEQAARGEFGRRGRAAGADELVRILGGQSRVEAAERSERQAREIRVAMENRINAQITFDANSVAEQLTTQLQPAIVQAMQALLVQSRQQVEKQLADLANANNLQNPAATAPQ